MGITVTYGEDSRLLLTHQQTAVSTTVDTLRMGEICRLRLWKNQRFTVTALKKSKHLGFWTFWANNRCASCVIVARGLCVYAPVSCRILLLLCPFLLWWCPELIVFCWTLSYLPLVCLTPSHHKFLYMQYRVSLSHVRKSHSYTFATPYYRIPLSISHPSSHHQSVLLSA